MKINDLLLVVQFLGARCLLRNKRRPWCAFMLLSWQYYQVLTAMAPLLTCAALVVVRHGIYLLSQSQLFVLCTSFQITHYIRHMKYSTKGHPLSISCKRRQSANYINTRLIPRLLQKTCVIFQSPLWRFLETNIVQLHLILDRFTLEAARCTPNSC